MKEIVLDGKKIDTVDELHIFLKKELDFPNYYGMNLDALWDCLTDGFAEPTKIVWINIDDSKKKLGRNVVDLVIDIFKEGKEYMKDYRIEFDYEVKR